MSSYAIIGGSGQLGTALREALAACDVVAPSHTEVDVADAAAMEAFLDDARPGVLINCAAFHKVEDCEADPVRALEVNAIAVDRAAAACAARGIAFATISTDYVFAGTGARPYRTSDAAMPLNAYGVSKLAGEGLAARHGERWFVFRSAGVYGRSGYSNKGPTLLERVIGQAERGEPSRVVNDLTLSPSYAPHVAATMIALIDAGAFGLHHVAGTGATSWHGFAQYAFDQLGLGAIEPVRSSPGGVRRPPYSALENDTLAAAGIAPVPAWQAGVDAFLAARARRTAVAGPR